MAHDSAGRRVSGILANRRRLNCRSEVICLQNRIVRGMEGIILIWKNTVRQQNMSAGKHSTRLPEKG